MQRSPNRSPVPRGLPDTIYRESFEAGIAGVILPVAGGVFAGVAAGGETFGVLRFPNVAYANGDILVRGPAIPHNPGNSYRLKMVAVINTISAGILQLRAITGDATDGENQITDGVTNANLNLAAAPGVFQTLEGPIYATGTGAAAGKSAVGTRWDIALVTAGGNVDMDIHDISIVRA